MTMLSLEAPDPECQGARHGQVGPCWNLGEGNLLSLVSLATKAAYPLLQTKSSIPQVLISFSSSNSAKAYQKPNNRDLCKLSSFHSLC